MWHRTSYYLFSVLTTSINSRTFLIGHHVFFVVVVVPFFWLTLIPKLPHHFISSQVFCSFVSLCCDSEPTICACSNPYQGLSFALWPCLPFQGDEKNKKQKQRPYFFVWDVTDFHSLSFNTCSCMLPSRSLSRR